MNLVTGTRRPRRDARQASEIVRERARKATKSMTTDLQGGQIRPRLVAMYLLVTARKGISSLQLAKEIGVTQKTAWFVLGRLREACGGHRPDGVQITA